jgi:hypothetical protein
MASPHSRGSAIGTVPPPERFPLLRAVDALGNNPLGAAMLLEACDKPSVVHSPTALARGALDRQDPRQAWDFLGGDNSRRSLPREQCARILTRFGLMREHTAGPDRGFSLTPERLAQGRAVASLALACTAEFEGGLAPLFGDGKRELMPGQLSHWAGQYLLYEALLSSAENSLTSQQLLSYLERHAVALPRFSLTTAVARGALRRTECAPEATRMIGHRPDTSKLAYSLAPEVTPAAQAFVDGIWQIEHGGADIVAAQGAAVRDSRARMSQAMDEARQQHEHRRRTPQVG